MNYKEFSERVIMLLNQFSLAGDTIEPSYNGQYDDLVRIPAFLDSAQKYIATTVKPIYVMVPLDWETAEERNGFYMFQLPSDFYRLTDRGIPVLENGEFVSYHGYRLMGRDRLVIPVKDRAVMDLCYYRYPNPVPSKPGDRYELDNTPEAQDAAAYYVAAYLAKDRDPFTYQALYNEFESRRNQMMERPTAEYELVEDAFATNSPGIYVS